jgi:GNAT superfamily N-acetyltransferase
MSEDPFKDKEKLAVRLEIAKSGDEQVCLDLMREARTGSDAEMFNVAPEEIEQEGDLNWWKKVLSPDSPESKNIFFGLAFIGSEAQGIGRIKKTDKEGVWTMGRFYVQRKSRGKFFPPKALARALDEIRARGGSKVVINVDPKNTANRLYEILGFKTVPSSHVGYNEMELDNLDSPELLDKINAVLDKR